MSVLIGRQSSVILDSTGGAKALLPERRVCAPLTPKGLMFFLALHESTELWGKACVFSAAIEHVTGDRRSSDADRLMVAREAYVLQTRIRVDARLTGAQKARLYRESGLASNPEIDFEASRLEIFTPEQKD